MISAATFEELAGYAARGRIGATVTLRCDNLHPEAGSTVVIDWSSDEAGRMMIGSRGPFSVPTRGRHRVNVDAEPVLIHLICGRESAEMLIRPQIFVPTACLHVPARMVFGVPARIRWQSDAESCVLRLIDQEGTQEIDATASGCLDVTPRYLGALSVELAAIGRHAHLSATLGTDKQTRTIEVVAPPVSMFLDAREKCAFVGEEIEFAWTISGAHSVRVEAPDRGEAYTASLIGRLLVEVGYRPERFRVVAVGFDGAEYAEECRVVPRLPEIETVSFNLDILNHPLEMRL
ncbi:hypothetical protein [Propionivibrio dicarboxylicus]|uniref:Uncharacterized protein n=1 Tax=Propionivibrio dicarboxylicus TaxID=83767 RepID=A0A1G7Z0S6_9RHOO|nr:hypothetical protein [Propionivibrio dicarboxylicus]SDH02371.1 hypothetical protein SAMN05660652_01041 [Propionivibrio dicarboxylicus]